MIHKFKLNAIINMDGPWRIYKIIKIDNFYNYDLYSMMSNHYIQSLPHWYLKYKNDEFQLTA